MAYRNDPDLAFLEGLSSASLGPLVDVLTKDWNIVDVLIKDWKKLPKHERYKESWPDHHEYWDLIAAEIQRFGAHTLAKLFRGGEGVLYREVLIDVCEKMKVNYNKASDVEIIEFQLLAKVLTDSVTEMSASDLEAVCDDLKLSPRRYTPEAVTVALQTAIRIGGFSSYKIAVIVANAFARKLMIGSGLSLAANAALTRLMSVFVGPIGLTLTAVWLVTDLFGPAYRVTIPSVVMVAYLRVERMELEKLERKRRKKGEEASKEKGEETLEKHMK